MRTHSEKKSNNHFLGIAHVIREMRPKIRRAWLKNAETPVEIGAPYETSRAYLFHKVEVEIQRSEGISEYFRRALR